MENMLLCCCIVYSMWFVSVVHAACHSDCTCAGNKIECINIPEVTEVPTTASLGSITLIEMDRVNITRLKQSYFSQYPALQSVAITNSSIEVIDEDTFHANSALQVLNLRDNLLTEPDWFARLSPIPVTQLQLSGNRIQYLLPSNRYELLLKQHGLFLKGNRLHCNCDMIWFLYMCEVMVQIWSWTAEAECYSPPSLAGMDILGLQMDSLRCSGPQIPQGIHTSIQVKICEPLVVTCASDGDPTPTMTLIHPDSSVYSVDTTDPSYDMATGYNSVLYTVNETMLSDSGLYVCNISGYSGWTTYEITVTVIGTCGSCEPCSTTVADATTVDDSTSTEALQTDDSTPQSTISTTTKATTTTSGLSQSALASADQSPTMPSIFTLASLGIGGFATLAGIFIIVIALSSKASAVVKKPPTLVEKAPADLLKVNNNLKG